MEILKGMVRDVGYPDVECTYAKIDDNTIYYFIEAGELPNGNIIASTVLKEAIGHTPYTSLGLINKNGDIIIPFENKIIKQIKDSLLLVEKNKPTSENVLEALKNKSDPFSASTLVETATTIKSQMKNAMGMSADFIFDNQFSEAAIYTMDGINVANGYYSYISECNSNYYFASNVANGQIIKFNPDQLQEMDEQNTDNSLENSEKEEQNMDNTSVGNSKEEQDDKNDMKLSINIPDQSQEMNEQNTDNSLENNETEEQNMDNTSVENSEEEQDSNSDIKLSINIPDQSQETDEQNTDNSLENNETEEKNVDNTSVEDNEEEKEDNSDVEDSDTNISNQSQEMDEQNIDNSLENNETEEQNIDNTSVEDDEEEQDNNDNTSFENNEEEQDNNDNTSFENNEEEQNDDEEITNSFDEVSSNESIADSNEYEQTTEHPIENQMTTEDISNPVIADATNTIKKLLKENREQRQRIDKQYAEIEVIKSNYDILKEESSSSNQEVISLRQELNRYRTQSIDLNRENTKLKSTLMRQSDVMKDLKKQNIELREQVAGIHALGNAVAEANVLIEPNNKLNTGLKEFDYNDINDTINYGKINQLDNEVDSYQKTKVA